jgi:CDP-glycerol glycerophosphotransferase (TagB/SpsB family)
MAQCFSEWAVVHSREELEQFGPDLVLANDAGAFRWLREYCDRRHAWLVGLRHGAANKYIGPDPEFAFADYVCGSDWDREDFARHDVAPLRKFLVTGNPWVDDIFRIPPRPLNEKAPMILFAPTYNIETSAAVFFDAALVRSIREVYPHSRIMIKPHPLMLDDAPPSLRPEGLAPTFERLVAHYRQAASTDPLVTFVDDGSRLASEFYADADILVSDGSSLIFEFMTLERPILLYSSRRRVKQWSGIWDGDAPGNAMRDVGVEFSSAEGFRAALSGAFRTHERSVRSRQREATGLLYGDFRDGRSAERAAAALASEPDLSVLVLPRGRRGAELCADATRLLRNRRVIAATDEDRGATASAREVRLARLAGSDANTLTLRAADELPEDSTPVSVALQSLSGQKPGALRLSSPLGVDDRPIPSVEFVLSDVLPRTITWLRRRGITQIAVYGAGAHTERLIPVWRTLSGPSVVVVLTTTESGRANLDGVPILAIDQFDPEGVEAIVLSSQSFEHELAAISEERWPDLPTVRLYWHSTCSITGQNRECAADFSNFFEQRRAV